VAAAERPLLVAIAERQSAERYRGWAAQAGSPARREALLACAAREEEIAGRVEALASDAGERQRRILEANPDLGELVRAAFDGRPLAQQYAMQAAGERAGAALWRTLAGAAGEGPARETYLACARLEEASAELLESLAS
jgi:hypothetical protein